MVVEVLPPDAELTTCPTCGHRELVLHTCECGHIHLVHDLAKDNRTRTACTTMTAAAGKCGCRKFRPA